MSRRETRGGDLPLMAWGEQLRRRKAKRRREVAAAAIASITAGLVVGTIIAPRAPHWVWNATASAPIGLYHVSLGAEPIRGTMVIARLPDAVRPLATERRYIPVNVPLVKHVGAVPGDTVCAIGPYIRIDGKDVAIRRAVDGHGRAMPWWSGCHLLRQGEIFLLSSDVATSFDGRYFGVSSRADIIGTAQPIWTR